MNRAINDTDALIAEARNRGFLHRFFLYSRLSGPGWLQGAITLGGGSLAGALYLGIIAGFGLLWLQPVAMICGIIMLSAIAYVTLSTQQAPFGLVNSHLSPALGWAWLIATVMANIVWSMPQFNLARAALQQNLFPAIGDSNLCTLLLCLALFALTFGISMMYESEGRGRKIFDLVIKLMVGLIVLSFMVVVWTLWKNGGIRTSLILGSLIPDVGLLFQPAEAFRELIARSSHPDWWTARIINDQRDVIIAAFGTAVGINMTWLLPYSLLKKKWGPLHRGLSIVDLSIGLLVPFFLATSCVVIAAASQFHGVSSDVDPAAGAKTLALLAEAHPAPPNDADVELSRMLVKRDNFQLANALEPLSGKVVSQKIFGLGVLGMAVSTIIVLMLMNGLAFQEMFGCWGNRRIHYLGCVVAGVAGMAGPFLWTGAAAAALAIPTSVIGGSLIPIAYFTFFLMMNSRSILGNALPRGGKRILWNVLMGLATGIATFGSIWVLSGKANLQSWKGMVPAGGLVLFAVLFVTGLVSFLVKERRHS